MPSPLLLIDASNWLFRAFHALPPLTNAQGEPTGAIYGFANMLRRLDREIDARRIAVVFDDSGRSFRNDWYPQYKANRSETPAELQAQFEPILELIQALGYPLLKIPGVEADDVIGTLARQAEAAGDEVLIVTGDKDMAQLVGPRVHLLDTMRNRRLDPDGVREKFGVPPERIVDYLTLMGDSVDNIPGVPGVGEKTAARLIQEHGSLDGVVAAAPTIKGKLGENLRAALPQLPLSRRLATIHCEVALPVTPAALLRHPPQPEALLALYRRLGFHRWAEEMAGGAREPAPPAPPPAPAAAGAGPAPPSASASPRTQARLVLDESALAELVAALKAAPLISFDTETDGLDANQCRLVGFAFAVREGEGWYVPVGHDYLGAPAQLPLATVVAAVGPLLEDPQRPKLAQHGKFDCNVLVRHGIRVQGLAYDTMLESYVLDAASGRHDMDTLAEKHLGHTTIKFEDVAGKGKAQIGFNQVSLERAAEYSAEDADITLRLHQALYPRLSAVPALREVFDTLEMPLVPVLAAIEQTGVRVDAERLRSLSRELAEGMERLQAEAFQAAGGEFNLGSPKQLAEILYQRLGLPVLGRTPKGDPSTAEEVIEQLAAEHALPRLILDWRGLSKLRSTYAEQLPQAINPRTGRIHTSYHQAVAATGRLSSSDPNLQNIPVRTAEGRRIRQAFVAEPGHQLCSIDYSQIELRLMAHFSGDERLQRAFREGLDIHQATAAEVFGLALEAVGPEQRRAAKAINFGLIYGISAFGLARNLGIGRNEAQETIDRFFARYPGVRAFMDGTRERARRDGYVETLFGRRLYLPQINARNPAQRQYAERTAINAPLQGTAADLIKRAMIELQAWLASAQPAIRMILQVHDELVFEGPAEALREWAPRLAARMCAVRRLAVPLVADYGFGQDWDSAHQAVGHARSEDSAAQL
ncbi:MAG TPA: DNA polymerase I [Nevskiaceae bacterium]|nr:DNA polymerase I [Nevskiaceae bacterium]